MNTGKLYGESQTVELPVGTYYVKETKAPTQGWTNLDGTVYTVNVKESNTASQPVVVGSKDAAKRAWFQIKKVTTNPDVKESMEGAMRSSMRSQKWRSPARAHTGSPATGSGRVP